MIIIITKNKKTNKVLPMISLLEEDKISETKKQIKKQLIEQIINEPTAIKAYKELTIEKAGIFEQETGKIENIENEKILDYEEIFNELIETLTKEKDKNE